MSDDQEAADAAEEAEHDRAVAEWKQWMLEHARLLSLKIHNVDRRSTSDVRRSAEEQVFERVAHKPRNKQVEILASLWMSAAELDERSRPLRGAIEAMEKAMPREDVWRMLQAAADAYRDGEPLRMKDRVTLLAEKHLERDKERRRGVMADALYETDSKARNMRTAVKEMVSKAEKASAGPLPATRPVDVRDRFPLLLDLLRALGVRVELLRADRSIVEVVDPVADPEQRLPTISNG